MTSEEKDRLYARINGASPLELPNILKEIELYDEQDTIEVLNCIYEEFDSGDDLKKEVLIPVFTSIADGFLESTSATRKLRKKGLTASRIVKECQEFSYENPGHNAVIPNAYEEYRNARDFTAKYGDESRIQYTNNRNIFEDDSKEYYKKRAVAANKGYVNLIDEYTGERNITPYKNSPDGRRNDPTNRYQLQPDHIVPLAKVHEYLKGNYALSNDDITRIGNSDSNLALTAARINQGEKGKGGKNDMTNPEFVEDQRKKVKNGEPNLDLSEETLTRMLLKDKEAREAIDKMVNETVKDNLLGKGTVSNKEYKEAYEKSEKILGRELTVEDRAIIDQHLAREKQKQILSMTADNALSQTKDYLVGNIVLYIIKPLYYEMADILSNGLCNGVKANNCQEAFKFRFGRIKDYVLANAKSFAGDNIWEFVKGLISSFIEGLISLFVGIFKQILKLIKEGCKVFIQACKVIWGEQSKSLTASQKGDAIIKLIGGSVIAMCGIGLEALINKIGIPDPWSVVISTALSGIASALFMLMLNKLDLFSVKPEKRLARVKDIFQERIKDIEEATIFMNETATSILKQQIEEFRRIVNAFDKAVKDKKTCDYLPLAYDLADFFKIKLPYTHESFIEFMDAHPAEVL